MKHTIHEDINVPFNLLTQNIYENIFNYLKKKKINTCTNEYGYITDIYTLKTYKCKKMSIKGFCVYDISYDVECIKPTKDSEWEGKLIMKFQEGIFVEIKKLFTVMIANEYIKKKENLDINSTLNVKITNILYSHDNQFKCLGKLR